MLKSTSSMRPARFDLIGGNQDLADVLVHIAEMLLHFKTALAQAARSSQIKHLVRIWSAASRIRASLSLLHHLDPSINSDGDTSTTRAR